MKRQKTSEATMSWFESMRGSQLIHNDLRINRKINDFLTCHFPATFSVNPSPPLLFPTPRVRVEEHLHLIDQKVS
jgi:hypothetical protein